MYLCQFLYCVNTVLYVFYHITPNNCHMEFSWSLCHKQTLLGLIRGFMNARWRVFSYMHVCFGREPSQLMQTILKVPYIHEYALKHFIYDIEILSIFWQMNFENLSRYHHTSRFSWSFVVIELMKIFSCVQKMYWKIILALIYCFVL